MIRIAIANQQRHLKINRQRLRAAVRRVLRGESIADAEISIACVDDATIQRLNEQFLKHQGPTDVITFPLSVPGAPLVGEIVLSAETAKRMAAEFGHAAEREVLLYVTHGVLHLCGYDDHTARDRRRMREREAHYLIEACG
jgi:probable rRNA maturation factor